METLARPLSQDLKNESLISMLNPCLLKVFTQYFALFHQKCVTCKICGKTKNCFVSGCIFVQGTKTKWLDRNYSQSCAVEFFFFFHSALWKQWRIVTADRIVIATFTAVSSQITDRMKPTQRCHAAVCLAVSVSDAASTIYSI